MVIWPWGYRCFMCHRGSELTLIQLVVSSQPNPFQSSWIITPNNIMSNMDSIMIILWVSNNIVWLVVSTPLKNMRKSVGMIIPNIRKVIKFHGSKPPTSYSRYNESLSSLWIPNNLDAGEVPIEWRNFHQHLSSFVPNWLTIVCPKETRAF